MKAAVLVCLLVIFSLFLIPSLSLFHPLSLYNRCKSCRRAFIDFAECLCSLSTTLLCIYLFPQGLGERGGEGDMGLMEVCIGAVTGEGWTPSGSGSFHLPSRALPEVFLVTHEKASSSLSSLSLLSGFNRFFLRQTAALLPQLPGAFPRPA